jgi:hypothetical protein
MRLALSLCALCCACEGPTPIADGGRDAAMIDGGMNDGGRDAGPPPTGCHLWTGEPTTPDAGPLPLPGDFPPPVGPGAPNVAFEETQLHTACAYLPVGPTDEDHHNTGFFLDGYLVRPWAHERGRGGIAVWDISDPCNPALVSNVLDEQIRETHSTGLSNIGGRFIAVASLTGVQIWDAADVTNLRKVIDFPLPGVTYPNSYMRVVMSVFWQAPYMFIGGSDNGVFIVDATDPESPVLVAQYAPSQFFRIGQVIVVGNELYAFSSEGASTQIFDVGDPTAPREIPGGRFVVTNGELDRFGRPMPQPAYFAHVNGGHTYHPRIGLSGGLAIFDVSDPGAPRFVGDFDATDGDGGYVYLHEGIAFVGLSSYGIALDVRDPSAPELVARFDHVGDVDTITPFGNVAIVSVDDDAIPGQASAVMPFATAIDTSPPAVNMVAPHDGASDLPLSTRIGLTFTEFVEMGSVWRGSVIVREVESGRVVEGHLSGQEGIVSFWPTGALRPATEHEVVVPVGGVTDLNGNAITVAFRSTFTTVACDP